MSFQGSSTSDRYLRLVEEELLIKGGRWIATFNVAIRNFSPSKLALKKKNVELKNTFTSLIYGGVKGKGFMLSRAFSFLASPTYQVGCAIVKLDNPERAKWPVLVKWMREARILKEALEFEWMWLLFFGEGRLRSEAIQNFERHTSRVYGMLYADTKNIEIFHSDSFISRRGAKLFHPKNMIRKKSRFSRSK